MRKECTVFEISDSHANIFTFAILFPFQIISVLIAVVAADVSHLSAYNYNRPNSYVPPASGSPFGQNGYYQSQTQYDNVLTAPKVDASYNQRLSQLQQYQSNSYQASAAREFTPGQTPTYQQTAYSGQAQQTAQAVQQPQTSYAAQQQQTVQQLPPIVTKHFYVHAAPEDPEEQAGPRFVQLGRARKTYKVIFIKAPSYGASSQIIPVLPQNEEKTIVYVLSKKPDFSQNIQLPEQPVTEPSKPDVFFIKYKTQQEAESARQQIQGMCLWSAANGQLKLKWKVNLILSVFTAAYDNADTNIDSNAIQQGAGLFDVRSSADEQSTGPSNQQSGQYTDASKSYDSAAYNPNYSASNTNYAQSAASSLPNYLPPNHTH